MSALSVLDEILALQRRVGQRAHARTTEIWVLHLPGCAPCTDALCRAEGQVHAEALCPEGRTAWEDYRRTLKEIGSPGPD